MLSSRLGELISELGVKKGDFAGKIGFSQAYVSMILSGKRQQPTDRFFESIHRAYHVSVDWLRDGEGEMFSLAGLDPASPDASLLKKYQSLSVSERKVVDEILDAMVLKRLAEQNSREA